MTCASCGSRCHGRYCTDCGFWKSHEGDEELSNWPVLLPGDRVRATPANGAAPAEGVVEAWAAADDHDLPVDEPVATVAVGEETWRVRASNVERLPEAADAE